MKDFEKNVFVNCPFDQEYRPLLHVLIFTLLYLGFRPRLALERSDSGESRLHKIVELIHESKFGIHDLSRCQAHEKDELFRLNMPLELGIDMGCKYFPGKRWKTKRLLVLETERYRYQAAISDLSGCDIKAHQNDADLLIKAVRDWLVQEASLNQAPPVSEMSSAFQDFYGSEYDRLRHSGWTEQEIAHPPTDELKRNMMTWMASR